MQAPGSPPVLKSALNAFVNDEENHEGSRSGIRVLLDKNLGVA